LGPCPKCSGAVYEHGMNYICERSVGPEKSCDFFTGKVILQQEVSEEQVEKLLATGKTDLLTNFKSSRTGRMFKAYLVRQETGKIGFEFEVRLAKAPAKKRAGETEEASSDSSSGDAPAKKPARKRASSAKKAAT
ncbi:MAG: hypothetical protein RLY27_122, partial [Pseudomonadota bacterium]